MLDALSRRNDIKTVILSANWSYLMPILIGKEPLSAEALLEMALRDTVAKVLATGKRVDL